MTELPLVVLSSLTFSETRAAFAGQARIIGNDGEEPWPRSHLLENVSGADGFMAFMTDRIDGEFFDACPRLKVIGAALKGFDNIDVAEATRRGVIVTIVPDLLTEPTAELAIGLAIAAGRRMREGDALIRASGFSGWRPRLYGASLHGATAGIIGFGQVGHAIARRLTGFGCRILASDRHPFDAKAAGVLASDLATLLAASDFVFLGMPLTAETTGLIGAQEIARMKPGAILVNPARGSLVDEAAVADALEEGHLGAYAADVFAFEDWARADRPHGIDPRLTARDAATFLTPHIGSATIEARREIELSAAYSICDVLSGRPPLTAINRPAVRASA